MDSNSNETTKEGLSREIKQIREQILDTCFTYANTRFMEQESTSSVRQSVCLYEARLQTQVQHSETVIPKDENLMINEFLAEMKMKNAEVEKLNTVTRQSIYDVEDEIQRLEIQITNAEKTLSKPQVDPQDTSVERLERAKDDFRILKTELHKVIKSIFKNDSDSVFDITGELIKERLVPESNGYIQLSDDTYRIGELLKDVRIASENPYDDTQIKLAF